MTTDPRCQLLDQAQSSDLWDIIVIGGGATGLACAWDAASRGYKVALLEQADFATATSSRSSKLLHGGVRYLQNGELGLVREALHERTLLLKNAPEFSRATRFILPTHTPLERYYYRIGMELYDALAGKSNIQPAKLLSQSELRTLLPNYRANDCTGGIAYSDAQFDDAALAIAFAQCINASGNLAINYVSVNSLILKNNTITGVHVTDQESGKSWPMHCKALINATGIFSDTFRNSNACDSQWKIRTSRGSHIVVPGDILGSQNALILPKTSDGRVLFIIPWKGHSVIGTTDIPTDKPLLHPTPSEQEIAFLIKETQSACSLDPSQITSSWAGLRPLVSRAQKTTAALSRKHIIDISSNGLISILGGKWTTCRKMAEDTLDATIKLHQLPQKSSQTSHLKLTEHGATPPVHSLLETPATTISQAEILHHFQRNYARTADDILARRTRLSMLDATSAAAQEKDIDNQLTELRATTHQEEISNKQ